MLSVMVMIIKISAIAQGWIGSKFMVVNIALSFRFGKGIQAGQWFLVLKAQKPGMWLCVMWETHCEWVKDVLRNWHL